MAILPVGTFLTGDFVMALAASACVTPLGFGFILRLTLFGTSGGMKGLLRDVPLNPSGFRFQYNSTNTP